VGLPPQQFWRRHLRSANRHLLAVPRFWLDTYGRRAFSVAGPMARILSGIQRAAQTVLGVYLKRTYSRVTSASSALGVLNVYALYKSTHSLTHSIAYFTPRKVDCGHGVRKYEHVFSESILIYLFIYRYLPAAVPKFKNTQTHRQTTL